MKIREVFILGAGAIGSVFGALLSTKIHVTLVGRKPHVEAVRDRGLQLTGDIDRKFYMDTATGITSIPRDSLIILTTKAYDTIPALSGVKNLLDDSIVMVLQNGLGNELMVKATVGEQIEVLRGITLIASEFLSPGKIRFWMGETVIENSRVSPVIQLLFNKCGLVTHISNDIQQDIWLKLTLNCVIGPLTALFLVSNPTVTSENLAWIRQRIVMECLNVARVEGVELNTDLKEIDRKILKYTNFSSMCQDIKRGKRTEIEFLNGKVVELGRKHRISTPVNETLTCLIRFLEETQIGVRKEN